MIWCALKPKLLWTFRANCKKFTTRMQQQYSAHSCNSHRLESLMQFVMSAVIMLIVVCISSVPRPFFAKLLLAGLSQSGIWHSLCKSEPCRPPATPVVWNHDQIDFSGATHSVFMRPTASEELIRKCYAEKCSPLCTLTILPMRIFLFFFSNCMQTTCSDI